MKSNAYSVRRKLKTRKIRIKVKGELDDTPLDDSFRTDQIAIRGFARELKYKLLEGDIFSLEEPEYSSVSAAFNVLWKEKYPTKDNDIFKDGSGSGFSKWWNGQQYPSIQSRVEVDKLFPGLSDKWFNRVDFKDRMQLHLASLDLFHMSRNCNCPVDNEYDVGIETHCNNCLSHALDEAEWILRAIHEDWQVSDTGFLEKTDVCISGPKSRSSLNVAENIFYSIYNDKETDQRRMIDYNLSLGKCSFVGLPIPEEIVKIYQDENPFSITLFLFLLVG